jgi:hypothetical protein
MSKKDLDQMSKIELLEYSKRARYMLGKVYSERLELERELAEMKIELAKARKANQPKKEQT